MDQVSNLKDVVRTMARASGRLAVRRRSCLDVLGQSTSGPEGDAHLGWERYVPVSEWQEPPPTDIV